MATAHAQRRMTKHELKEDAFTTTVFKAREWVEENMRMTLAVVVGILVVIAAVWGFFMWRSSQANEANAIFGQAGVEMRSGNPPAAIAQFQKLLDEYPSADVTGVATMQFAQLQFRQRAFDDARVLYQRYVDDYGDDPMLVSAAWAGQASVDEQAGFYAEAESKFMKAYESDKTGFAAAEYLRRAIRCAVAADDSAKALADYELLKKEFPKDAANINTAKQSLIEHGFLDPATL